MNQYLKHLKTISKHKWYVMVECFKIGLYWQGLLHDLSKFTPIEFASSAKYFQGTGSPIDKERAEIGYSRVWLNHKAKNKHHYQYWVDFKGDKIIPVDMPTKYILEMACDFIGAGKAYNPEGFNQGEPLKYWNEKVDKSVISEDTQCEVGALLKFYANEGRFPKGY